MFLASGYNMFVSEVHDRHTVQETNLLQLSEQSDRAVKPGNRRWDDFR